MRVALLVLALFGVFSSGCASRQGCVRYEPCFGTSVPAPRAQAPLPPEQESFWRLFCAPSDDVRAARLKLAAAIILISGEVALEIIKAQR